MPKTQKITPHLWFEKRAEEAAEFYVDAFGGNSRIKTTTQLHGTPSGDVDTVSFQLLGFDFTAIGAGPLFTPNPSVSFIVNFDPSKNDGARADLDALWGTLSDGGEVAMPLDTYPFSKRYGWIQDRYGISWQLNLIDPDTEERPIIIPSLLFVTDTCDKAEEATDFYLSVFKNTKRGALVRYPAGMEPNKEGAVMFTDFQLEGQWFAATDGSSEMHNFAFNEAISLMVYCDTQEEIDYYWEKLSAVPEAEQCGWLKDKYGVSWQIIPTIMDQMMREGNEDQVARVTKAFLKMKKFNIKDLKAAYGEE